MKALPPYHKIKIEKLFHKDPINETSLVPDNMKRQAVVEVIESELEGRYIAPRGKIITKGETSLIHEDDLTASI